MNTLSSLPHGDGHISKEKMPLVEASELATRIESALKTGLPKELSESKSYKLYKNTLLQRLILKSFLSDIIFGTRDQLAKGEVLPGFNDYYREMIKGKSSHFSPFKKISSQKVEISLQEAKESKKIVGYKFSKEGDVEQKPLALIFTGSFNPSEIYAAPLVSSYLNQGFDVMVIDPVGFGDSVDAGSPTPANFLQSAEAAARFCRKELKVANEKVVLHGFSLGGFAAAHVAGLKENEGMNVVLDRCPSSAKSEATRYIEALLPSVAGSVAGQIASKVVGSCIRFNLRKMLPKIHGRVFVAQADLSQEAVESQRVRKKGSSAYALVEKLEAKNKLGGLQLTKSLEAGEHITTFRTTWTQRPSSSTNSAFKSWLNDITHG